MRQLHIAVTQEDIRNASGGNFECPIALAANRALPKGLQASVHYTCIALMNSIEECGSIQPRFTVGLPAIASEFVHIYDSAEDEDGTGEDAVVPFEFSIEVPDEVFEEAA